VIYMGWIAQMELGAAAVVQQFDVSTEGCGVPALEDPRANMA
jgi:hypothetical protein